MKMLLINVVENVTYPPLPKKRLADILKLSKLGYAPFPQRVFLAAPPQGVLTVFILKY